MLCGNRTANKHASQLKSRMPAYVSGDPYNWPYDGDLTPANTAVLVIDMQVRTAAHGAASLCLRIDTLRCMFFAA